MEFLEFVDILNKQLTSDSFLAGTISQPRLRSNEVQRIKLKKIEIQNELIIQFEYQLEHTMYHKNLPFVEAQKELTEQLNHFRQVHFDHTTYASQAQISKKFKVLYKTKDHPAPKEINFTHNRQKQYILKEDTIHPFLVELGVQTKDGKIRAAKHAKFKQINRFIEMVEDTFPHLPTDRPIRIIDFGSGKSYLTFAIYHYLVEIKKRDVHITGLDLKKEVIEHCENIARKLNYEQLNFQIGDISDYEEEAVDMVITLHACDVATDLALARAVHWGAKVIMSVPCCQHELFEQLNAPALDVLTKHGILKERFSALATDAIRAQLLQLVGYDVQLLEFVDLEHTPKNILIRAYATNSKATTQDFEDYKHFTQLLQAEPFLETELKKFGRL